MNKKCPTHAFRYDDNDNDDSPRYEHGTEAIDGAHGVTGVLQSSSVSCAALVTSVVMVFALLGGGTVIVVVAASSQSCWMPDEQKHEMPAER